MVEIRFHGRGGQGAVKGSDILAVAAFHEGKEVQAFPFFGVERRGAPVTAFTRISNEEIRIHCYIYDPDVLVILDPTLICAVPLSDGLKENGKIIINSMKEPSEFSFPDAKNPCLYSGLFFHCNEIWIGYARISDYQHNNPWRGCQSDRIG